MNIASKQIQKLFPHTFAGDQLRIVFSWMEEAEAFVAVISQIEAAISRRHNSHDGKWTTKREVPMKDFQFKTTLEVDIASEHTGVIKKIVGLSEFVVKGNNKVDIVPLPTSVNPRSAHK